MPHIPNCVLGGVQKHGHTGLWSGITPCSTSKVSRYFRDICRLHLQVWRIRQARNQLQTDSSSNSLSCRPITYNDVSRYKAIPPEVFYLTTYLPAHPSIFLSIYLSMTLQLSVGPWPLCQFLYLFPQSVGHLGRKISPSSQGRYVYTG
jgi:hypothetical protein